MPTQKTRINLTVPKDIDKAINMLAKRDQRSVSATALELIRCALEIEEDRIWAMLASKRDTKDARFVSHEDAWK